MGFKFEDPRYITVMVLLGFAGFVLRARLKNQVSIDWPLSFWLLAIGFGQAFDEFFDMRFLLAGLITTLIMRFEFMNDKLTALVRFCEIVILIGVFYSGLKGVGLI